MSGWELMSVQVVALALLAAMLWAVGAVFQRGRWARWMVLLLATVSGAVIALGLLGSAEASVSSYLFAAVLFALGTVAMSVMLLAAIPGTRRAAIGGLVFGGLLIVSFVLTYWAVFAFGHPRWISHPPGGLVGTER